MLDTKSNSVVELYGLPGIGKTTYAEAIALEEGFLHHQPTSVTLLQVMVMFACHPLLTGRWLTLFFRCWIVNRSFALLRYNLVLFFGSLQSTIDAHNATEQKVVIDEGLVQRLLSASDVVLKKDEVRRLLSLVVDTVTFVRVTGRTPTKKHSTSTHPRYSLDPMILKQWQANLVTNESNIANWLTEYGATVTTYSAQEKQPPSNHIAANNDQ